MSDHTLAILGLAVAGVSSLAAVAAAAWASSSVKQARIANGVAVLADFITEWRGLAPDRDFIRDELANYDPGLGIKNLPTEAKAPVVRVCHYVDTLGLLVEQELADANAIAGFIGDSIIWLWDELGPYIEEERRSRGTDYQEYFEHLAATVRDINPKKVRSKLRDY